MQRELGAEKVLVLRKPGTESLIRVMIETTDKALAEVLVNELAAVIKQSNQGMTL